MAETGALDPAGLTWRGIEEQALLVGSYCWMEQRVFAVTGSWAGRTGGAAELHVWCAAVSRRHGALAGCWAERLPVRAGVDPTSLVEAPSASVAEALGALADETTDTVAGVETLVGVLLPRLSGIYGAHLRSASPVAEAPVMEVLAGARRVMEGEIRGGRSLLEGFPDRLEGKGAELGSKVGERVERAFDDFGVFPAVRPS